MKPETKSGTEYSDAVARVRRTLPEVLFITLIEPPEYGLPTVEIIRELAARRIVEGTHRVATDEEVAAYRMVQSQREFEYNSRRKL